MPYIFLLQGRPNSEHFPSADLVLPSFLYSFTFSCLILTHLYFHCSCYWAYFTDLDETLYHLLPWPIIIVSDNLALNSHNKIKLEVKWDSISIGYLQCFSCKYLRTRAYFSWCGWMTDQAVVDQAVVFTLHILVFLAWWVVQKFSKQFPEWRCHYSIYNDRGPKFIKIKRKRFFESKLKIKLISNYT